MRIAIFAETYLPSVNGVVTHIKVLREGLIAAGHEVLVVTAEPGYKRHVLENGVLHCPAKRIKKLYGYGLANPVSSARSKIVEAFAPDICHIQQEFGIGLFGARFASKHNKPLVYTLHSMYDEYIFYIAPKPLYPLVEGVLSHYFRYLCRRAAVITSPSLKARAFFKRVGADKEVRLIPNSVEVDEFDYKAVGNAELAKIKSELGIAPGQTVAVFVGRLGKEKSVDLILRYWADHLKDEKALRLIIIGEGPDGEHLRNMAGELGLAGSVFFKGRVEHVDIAPYFAACDVFVTASLTEMMSISMLEGMAAGLPVLQRYDEANAGQIEEGVNGHNYKTPAEFAEHLKAFAALTPEEKEKKRAAVRASVLDAGSKRQAEYMLGVYEQAIREHKEK